MENKNRTGKQLTAGSGEQSRRNMPFLMGRLDQRNATGKRKGGSRADAGQKTRHIRLLYRAGAGGNAHRTNGGKINFFRKFFQHSRQGGGVMKYRIALAQTELPGADRQKFLGIANNLSGIRVEHGQRGCVIAGIDPERQHVSGSGAAASSAPACSRATVPSSPLTN